MAVRIVRLVRMTIRCVHWWPTRFQHLQIQVFQHHCWYNRWIWKCGALALARHLDWLAASVDQRRMHLGQKVRVHLLSYDYTGFRGLGFRWYLAHILVHMLGHSEHHWKSPEAVDHS